MSYVIKNGDLYLDENGSFVTESKYAERFASREEAMVVREAGDRIVRIRCKPKPTTLRDQVAEFHAMIGEPAPTVPTVPSNDDVRLRLALVLEETVELLEAAGVYRPMLTQTRNLLSDLRANIAGVRPDIVAMTDALADLDYVIEGTRQRFGINGGPIAAEVHRSNMAKRGAGKDENGKWQKPEGWTPPDIAGELRRQGWRGGAK